MIEHDLVLILENGEKSSFFISFHQKMTILQYEIENFAKLFLFLTFCMIEHDFVSILENNEKS